MSGDDFLTMRLALEAMATRFEMVLLGGNAAELRASGEEAFREIESIARRFSFYDPKSELSELNRSAFKKSVRLAPDLFSLLELAFDICDRTQGAFDPTVGPLMRCWGFYRGMGGMPDQDALAHARSISGKSHVILDPGTSSIRFDTEGVEIDLGGIAKGYAIDEATRLLREAGISNALLHGGTSAVMGIGQSYDATPWKIGISDAGRSFGTVELTDTSLSVSASSGKSFTHEGRLMGHVLDPRRGVPGDAAALAAVTGPCAAESDALSTASLILGRSAASLVDDRIGIGVWSADGVNDAVFVDGLSGFSPEFRENTPISSVGPPSKPDRT